MPRKHHKPDEIVAMLRQVEVLASQGKLIAESIRAIGVREVMNYRWWQEYGGLKSDHVKRLKDLKMENARLRRAVSDLSLDTMILSEAAKGRLDRPRRGRAGGGRRIAEAESGVQRAKIRAIQIDQEFDLQSGVPAHRRRAS